MSLVAWYPLIDGSLENKGLDTTPLTLHGTVPFTNGRVRTAPTFSANGSNWLGHSIFEAKANFSAFCWVKFNDHATFQYVFSQCRPDANADGWGIVRNKNREIAFCFGNLVNRLGTVVEDSTWAHVGLTVTENGTITGYVDGEQVYQETATDLPSYLVWQGFNLGVVGGNSLAQYSPLNGQLQDFRYYDHCLSSKEVKEVAKGLCLHLPLKGTNARPNLFKNSATMFNNVGGIPGSTTCTSSSALVFDENAPCGVNGKILRATVNRPDDTVGVVGGYFYRTSTGIPTLTIGQKYCVSVWARCTANNINFLLEPFMEGHTFVKGSGNTSLTSEWKRYYAIFTATKETSSTCFYIDAPIGASGTLEYCCPKLELLSPTPYIPNVDDTQYSDYVLDYEPDCSGNEFDATKYGDLTTSDSNGRYNTAVAFNGTNTYLQGLAPTNSECKEFTIATWMKLNDVSVSHTIYACRTVVGQGITLFYIGAGGFRFDDGVDNAVFTNSTLEPNKWYHIAVTRDTAERKLYINGSFVSSGATTTGALANMANMYQVGESNAQTAPPKSNYLNGSLSDFRLYTSVLSADDVKELYETSVSIAHNPPSLTESAYYNYVEGQKHSTFDKSKFTIVGSPTITDDGVASGFTLDNYVKTTIPNYSNELIIEGQAKCNDYSTNGRIVGNNIASNAPTLVIGTDGQVAFGLLSQATIKTGFYAYNNSFYYRMVHNVSENKWNVYFKNNYSAGWVLYYTKGTPLSNISGQNYFFGRGYSRYFDGTQDLGCIKIYSDGVEVFSGNKTGLDVVNDIEIPYTLGSTGIKIVDSVYLDRVKDVYDQHCLERYYTVDETTQTVYEYPLFRDSMHSYEFDEGFDQSIKKVGVMISPEFTETTDVNMVKGNTKTTKLIEV